MVYIFTVITLLAIAGSNFIEIYKYDFNNSFDHFSIYIWVGFCNIALFNAIHNYSWKFGPKLYFAPLLAYLGIFNIDNNFLKQGPQTFFRYS